MPFSLVINNSNVSNPNTNAIYTFPQNGRSLQIGLDIQHILLIEHHI